MAMFDIWELCLDILFLFDFFMLLNLFQRIIQINLFHQKIYWFNENVKFFLVKKSLQIQLFCIFMKKLNINNRKNIVEGEWIQKSFDYSFLFEYIINFTVRYFHVLELLVVLMCLIKSIKVFLFFLENVLKHVDSVI